jgi:hypothetical protein
LCDFFAVSEEQRSIDLLKRAIDYALAENSAKKDENQEDCKIELSLSDQILQQALLFTLPFPIDPQFRNDHRSDESIRNSLKELRDTYSGITTGIFRIYTADQDTQLLAYEIRSEDARIYVAINFSYDMYELPLPLGFMASTKIKLWRTDAPELNAFVTRGPLSIRAMTAAIVIVD